MAQKSFATFSTKQGAKPKPIAPCMCDFSHTLSKLQVIVRNSDWFINCFATAVIGWSNKFGIWFCNSHLNLTVLNGQALLEVLIISYVADIQHVCMYLMLNT